MCVCRYVQIHPAESKQTHSLTSYKTRHMPLHQGWTRQLSRRERVPHVGKEVRDSLCSHCYDPHRNTKLLCHNIYSEDLGQTPTGSLISAGSHQSQSVHSVGLLLVCP